MKHHSIYKLLGLILLPLLTYSCASTKYVGENEHLLNRVRIKTDNRDIEKSEVRKNIRQKPNTRILGIFRPNLGLYNLSGKDESKKLNQWLKNAGEPPVIYNEILTKRSTVQIENYLNNKGYYQPLIKDTVYFFRKKAYVEYNIHSGPRTQIEEFILKDKYNYTDNNLTEEDEVFQYILKDTAKSLIKPGSPLDVYLLESESERITRMLRDKGYFNFSKNFIRYMADVINADEDRARVLMNIPRNPPDTNAYKKYRIRDIRIIFDYDPLLFMRGDTARYLDTIYQDHKIKYQGKLKIRPRLIVESLQFTKGELYQTSKVLESYNRLQSLRLFKFVNLSFHEMDAEDSEEGLLSCEVQLTLLKRQSFNVALEGTHTSGNIGIGGNFTYDHRNLFKGGENLSLSFWGALKKEQSGEDNIFNSRMFGVEAKLISPQFWMPFFRLKDFRKNLAPKTSITISYSDEYSPYYDRQIATAKYGYFWRKADKKWRYNIDAIDFNYVMMNNIDSAFNASLINDYVRRAYESHIILSANFTATFTDQTKNVPGNYNYFRATLETSGNALGLINSMMDKSKKIAVNQETGKTEKYYTNFGVRYAQFIKADADYRFNQYINHANSFVYRFFIGCGFPYGNMRSLPLEEAFFVGGANGIRAWHSRTLGPGSYVSGESVNFPSNVGDFKLEGNIEYRYKLFWLLEGALFLDAGNVWSIYKNEDRKGSKLTNEFYRQIAVGTGLGLRLDAGVFVLRLDWGIKVKDPARPRNERFVLLDNGKWLRNTVFNIAIGYPF